MDNIAFENFRPASGGQTYEYSRTGTIGTHAARTTVFIDNYGFLPCRALTEVWTSIGWKEVAMLPGVTAREISRDTQAPRSSAVLIADRLESEAAFVLRIGDGVAA